MGEKGNREQSESTESTKTAGGSQSSAAETQTGVIAATETASAQTTAPGAATNPPQDDATAQPERRRVAGVDDYKRMRDAALKPTEARAQAAPAAAGETGETAEGEETASAGEGASEAVEGAEGGEGAEGAAAEGEGEVGEERVPDRVRLGRLRDDAEKRRIDLAVKLAANENITFDEAWERLKAKPAEAADGAAPAEDEPVLRTLAEIEADMMALEAEEEKAGEDLDTATLVKLRKRERALTAEREQVKTAEAEAAAQAKQVFADTVKTSWADASRLYPIKDPAFAKRMEEISDRLEKAGNEIVYEATAPYVIARMAGNELGIAPKEQSNGASKPKSSTPAATRPPVVQQRAVVRSTQPAGGPASGAARTTQGNGPVPIAQRKISSVADYEALKKEVGVKA